MDSLHPSQTYAAVMARQLGLDLHNQGVGSGTFNVDTLQEETVSGVEQVTVAFGVNDWRNGLTPDCAMPYLERLLQLYPNVPVAVFEPVWYPYGDQEHALFPDTETPFSAYRYGLSQVVDGFETIHFVPRHQLMPDGPSSLLVGGHPNTQGQMVYGQNAAVAIRALRG